MAEINEEPIGFVQIIDPFFEETRYWGDVEKNKRAIDIWIGEEENLNKGYGTLIMNLTLKKCFDNPNVNLNFKVRNASYRTPIVVIVKDSRTDKELI